MIFSPLIVSFLLLFGCFAKSFENFKNRPKYDLAITNLIIIPLAIVWTLLKFPCYLLLGVLATPVFTFFFIIENTKIFKKIMNYWSIKNRFKGNTKSKKEELKFL
jgi:hypothetical protein